MLFLKNKISSAIWSYFKNTTFLETYTAWNGKIRLKYSMEKSLQVFRVVKQLLHTVWMTDKRMYTPGNTHVPYHPSHRYIEYLTVSKHARLREDTFDSLAKTSQFCHSKENEKRIKVRFTEIHIFKRIF